MLLEKRASFRLRPAVPCAAEEQAVLLSEKPLHLRFLHGLPHEAQRRGPCLHLHPGHYGAGDALLHRLLAGSLLFFIRDALVVQGHNQIAAQHPVERL